MMLWFVLVLMTAAAIFSVLWPLSRRSPLRAGSDVAVYRDQLEEIDRDCAAGLIGEREAEAARVEVSRRLIAAAEVSAPAPAGGGLWRRRALVLAALVLLPVGAASLYLKLGSPELPSQPLAARLQAPPEHGTLVELVGRVEAHLEQNPNDGQGWQVLAPVYMRVGRFEDAVRARRNVLRLLGSTAERESDLGEALTGAANGVITAEARAAFGRAVGLDPDDFRARYFIGLASEQDGRPQDAAEVWRKLLAGAPANAPWTDFVRDSLARVESGAAPQPGPSAEDVAAAGKLPPDQQAEMVRGMVARLAERLKQDGSDTEGWLRLIRSYAMLGDRVKAQAAATDARRALAGDADKLRRIDDMAAALGQPVAPSQAGPDVADVAAAAKLPPEQQTEMARAMVAKLAERLKQDGSDVGGWARLVRSYLVLGERDKAFAADIEARRALADEPDKLRQFDEISRTLAGAQSAAQPQSHPQSSQPQPHPQPGPSAEDVAAAGQLSPDQRSEMVRGMVARLAERLKQDGSDVEGWQRLLRAYMVLGDKDKARAAADEARRALASDADKLRRIEEVIKGFGLSG